MSIAQRLVNFSDGLSAEGILSAAKGGTGTTTGAGSSTPTISAIGYSGDDTATNPAGGATITLTGTNFAAGAKVLINTTTVGVVTVVSSTQITFTAPQLAAGSYILYVVNLDGSTAIAVPGIQYSGTPAWSTAAGSLGTGYETSAVSTTVAATSDSAVSYSVTSGTLPDGVTINASGTISGTSPLVGGSTTYTFTVRATDLENQDTDREFSLTINPDVVTWSSANAITVQQDAASSTTLAATSAAGQTVSYAVDTLPAGLTLSGDTVSGTATVSGTTTTTATATAAVTGKTAQQTITWTVSIAADTYFKYTTLLLNSETVATPFLADASTNNFALTAYGDTKPSNFNPYTPGYYSNYFDGNGDVIYATESGGAFTFGTGDYEYSAWIFTTDSGSAQQTIFSRDNTGNAAVPYIYIQPTNRQIGLYYSSFIVGGTTAIAANKWYYITVSRVSGTSRIFVNGVLEGSAADSTNLTAAGKLVVGGQWTGNTNMFVGYISNARVVKGSGVTSVTVPTTPLTAITNTQLLTCQSNRLIDNSANAFALTKTGDVTVSPFDPFVPDASYATYGSTYFDGTGDYLSVPSNSALQLPTGDFTIEAWIYLTGALGSYYFIFTQTSTTNATSNWDFIVNGNASGQLRFEAFSGATQIINLIGTSSVPVNAWTHVAVTRSGSTYTIWMNGISQGTASSASTVNTNALTTYIGQNSNNTYYFPGYITDARIVKGTAVYTTAFTPPSAPLTAIANTSLLTLQTNQPHTNSQFLDNSTSALPITRAGNTTQGSFSPYGANWSNYFDGSGDYLSMPSAATTYLAANPFTIEAWVYPTAENGVIIGRRAVVTARGFWLAYGNVTSKKFSFYAGDTNNAGWEVTLTSTNAFELNKWHHVAITRNASNVFTLWVNGTSEATVTSSFTIGDDSSTLYVGTVDGGSTPFTGYMSNLRIVQNTALYTSTFTPPTQPLTDITGTGLLTCQSPNFVDNSSTAATITKAGDVRVQKFSPFSLVTQTPTTHSVGFDGTGDYLTLPSSSNLVLGSGDFCVEMWYYQQANAFAALFSNAVSSGGGDAQFELQIAASTFYPTVLAWATTFLTSSVASTPNAWNHIAVCRNGTTLSMFLNGTRVATTTTSNNFSSTNAFHISRQAAAAAGYINGYISNLRVVKGSSVYTPSATTITVPTQPLTAVANTQLLTCQSSTLIDNSVNQFAITAFGDAKPRGQNPFGSTTSSAQDYAPAVFGSSAYFDGTGDSLSIPAGTHLQFTGDYTIEFWIYFTSVSGTQDLVSNYVSSTSADWTILISTTFQYYPSSAASAVVGPTVIANRWYHVAAVRSGTTCSMYVDGVSVATPLTFSGTLGDATRPAYIGSRGGSGNYTSGYMADVRITKSAVYTRNFVPPTQPLQTVQNTTLLLNMDRAAVVDKSGKVVAETVGDVKLSTAVKKYGSQSMYFDGTGDYLFIPSAQFQNYAFGTGDFTIECWLYQTSFSGDRVIAASISTWASSVNFYLGTRAGSPNILIFRAGDGIPITLNGNTGITVNTWTHIAVSRASGVTRMFIGGVAQSATHTGSVNISATVQAMGIGAANNGTEPMSGYIDDLRITRGYARYTADFTPPAQALLTK